MTFDRTYLKRAVDLASKSQEPIGSGSLVVVGGKIVGEAYNSQHIDNQATYHAEIKALQLANTKLKSRTLKDAIVYCSCEPCVMCLAALSLAKVERIVYGKTMRELFPEDKMSQIDSREFVKQLNFIPHLEQLQFDQ